MNNSSPSERRKFPRFNIRIPLHLSFPSLETEDLFQATSVNVSLNGIYCTVNRYLSPFEKILIMFISPTHDGNPPDIILQCESVVVRIEPEHKEIGRKEYHVVLFFPHHSQQQSDVLQKLIESHTTVS